jgi:hypothetical protein
MSNEVMKTESNLVGAISELENQKKMCEMLLKTPHYAKLGAEGIYAVLAKAKSLDIDPFDALNGALYFVKGRVGMSTEAMAARVRSAGHSITKDPKSTKTNCILNGKRADNGDTWITEFSIDDAKKAGIYSDGGPWYKYPDVMCYNRAMSKMFRQMTPDLSKGAGYDMDELREIASKSSYEVEVVPQPVELVGEQEVCDLENILSECDPAYVVRVWTALKKSPEKIESLSHLTKDLYERIKVGAMKNREEFRASSQDCEEIETEFDELEESESETMAV